MAAQVAGGPRKPRRAAGTWAARRWPLAAWLSACALACGLGAGSAAAHPHVFIDVRPTLVFAKGRIVGVQVEWTLDAIFSSMLLHDFDPDHDKRFNADEVKKLQAGAFDNLKDYAYFTHFRLDGVLKPPASVQDFSASVDKDQITYRFVIRPPYFVDPKRVSFDLMFYDETYYVDLRLVEGAPVAVTGTDACTADVDKSPDLPDYGGMFIPELIHVRCK